MTNTAFYTKKNSISDTSHDALDPNVMPTFDNMPNVATMTTCNVNKDTPPFILVDGSYYLFRTYHALPKTMQNSQGLTTNAIRGTLNALLKLMRRYHPTHMAVCFDTSAPTFRHTMSEAYKANRPKMDAELAEQIPYIHRLVRAHGIPLLRIEGAEADDIIGTLTERAVAEGHHVVISTGDKDMAQLVNDCVVMEDSFTGKLMDTQGVEEKFGVRPEQMVDFLTLMGDSSDGIKGVAGVGKKRAKDLLNEYGTIDNILANATDIKGKVGITLQESGESIESDKQMATIITNLDIGQDWEDLRIDNDATKHIDELRALYTELEFRNELASLDHPNHPANAQNNSQSVEDSRASTESQAQIAKTMSDQQNSEIISNSAMMGGANVQGDPSFNLSSVSTTDNEADNNKNSDKAWHTILDMAELDALLGKLKAAPHFVIDTETTSINWREAELVGLSFSLQADEAYYIPLKHVHYVPPVKKTKAKKTAKKATKETPQPDTEQIIEPSDTQSAQDTLALEVTVEETAATIENSEEVETVDPLIAQQLNLKEVLDKLRPILEDPEIGKIGQHLKYDAHVLSKHDINLNLDIPFPDSVLSRQTSADSTPSTASESNKDRALSGTSMNWAMDTMLASYVINAAATRHGMDALARHYLQTQTITFEDVAGKGVKQLTFDQVAINLASDYACEDADITYQLFEVFQEKLKDNAINQRLLHQLEIPVAQILCQMEADGILIKRPFLNELSIRFDEEIIALEKQAYEVAGEEFNLGSPKQLGEVLFDKLGVRGGKQTKSGQYSTGEAVLSKVDHPLADIALEYRSLAKLKSTYTDALDAVADVDTDRVHTSYHQALTSTGRLSSTDPNLQNIPIRTPTGRLIRQAFIAPEGRVILAADYSQIELRLIAHFSGDKNLIRAFNEGLDIHTATAADILDKTVLEVTPTERRNAKAINFGLLYGMSAFGLSKQLQISTSEAQEYINLYFSRYPSVQQYMDDTRDNAMDNGYVETILGRKLYTPDINHSNKMVSAGAKRAAINAPLQGSAADLIKLAMIAVDEVLSKDEYKQHATMLLQVHDELVFEVDADKASDIALLVKNAMQNVISHTAKELGWEDISFSVPLLVETGVGDNWDEAH